MRSTLDGTKAQLLEELQKHLPGGCNNPSQTTISNWFVHVDRYLEAYSKGASGVQAYDYVKLHSHRRGEKAGCPKKEKVASHHRVPSWLPPSAKAPKRATMSTCPETTPPSPSSHGPSA